MDEIERTATTAIVPKVVRDAWQVGIGALAVAEEEIRLLVDNFTSKGGVSSDESKTLLKDILARIKKNKEIVEKKIEEAVDIGLKKLNIPTKEDVAELTEKVDALGKIISEAQKSKTTLDG